MKELVAEFGINRLTVSAHLRRAGVPTRREGLDPEQAVEVVAVYQAGWSSGQRPMRFGVSADTVLRVLRGEGSASDLVVDGLCPPRRRPDPRPASRRWRRSR